MGLCVLVHYAIACVVRICTILSQEEWFGRSLGKTLEQIPETQLVIVVDAPHVNGVQSFNDVQWWRFTIDGRHWMLVIVAFHQLCNLIQSVATVVYIHMEVTTIVVPLISCDPHQKGGMVFHSINLLPNGFHRLCSVRVDGVQNLNPVSPQLVQDGWVGHRLIGSYYIYSSLRHESCIAHDKLGEGQAVWVETTLGYRIPIHALHMEGHAIDVDPAIPWPYSSWQ